mmetsp:Transcript_46381/g.110231  ORF Transcript_46381/g.110231 Transcript_46381/m.110231 type:complete len:394 (-) Transcript_46381:46-1227(-)
MYMFLLLGHWLCICGAVTLRGSDVKETIPTADQSQIGVVPTWDRTRQDWPVAHDYVYNSSQLSILIPETRPLVTLPVVVLQAHTHFPELRIQIMYGSANKDYVRMQKTLAELRQKGVVLLTPMPGEAYNVSRFPANKRILQYNNALTSPGFWQLVTTPKVLLAQTDSWICNGAHEHLKDFLQYDYVGSPWFFLQTSRIHAACPKRQVGNGGFSLRDREAMLRITKSFQGKGSQEDVWFCSHLQDSDKLPSEEVAIHFARETFKKGEKNQRTGPTMPRVGVHNLWLNATEIRKFFEGQCPGVSLVNPRVATLDNSEGTLGEAMVQRWKQEALPRMVGLLQDTGSGMLDSVSLTLMAKIFAEDPLHDPLLARFLHEAAEAAVKSVQSQKPIHTSN